MNTIEAAKGKWGLIYKHFGLPPITGKTHYKSECPLCGKKGKFRISDRFGNGDFICTCSSGTGFHLLGEVTGLEFKELARQVDLIIGNTFTGERVEMPVNTALNNTMSRCRSAVKLRGSNVEAYLQNRGIFELPTKAMFASNGNMLCVAVDSFGNAVYSHETFLDGDKKSDVEANKKIYSLTQENYTADFGVIRLFDIAETLGIAEGIETAMSCKQIYKCNTWSAMNAVNLRKFKAPNGVKHLIIFADNDKNGTGLAAAFECANKNIVRQKSTVEKVTVRWCATVNDFNDMLLEGSQVFEWVLTK